MVDFDSIAEDALDELQEDNRELSIEDWIELLEAVIGSAHERIGAAREDLAKSDG